MATNQYQVGPALGPFNDNSIQNGRADNYGDQIVQEYNGRYAELARRGQLYWANMAAGGVAINIAATNPTAAPLIWNPQNSGKLVYILKLIMNVVTVGAAGSYSWYFQSTTGNAAGAPSNILTATTSAPTLALVGSSNAVAAKTLFAPQTATYTTAPAYYASSGLTIAATAANNSNMMIDYEGALILAPGGAFTLCATSANTSVVSASVLIAEVPAVGQY
jgi:hypothetical protein